MAQNNKNWNMYVDMNSSVDSLTFVVEQLRRSGEGMKYLLSLTILIAGIFGTAFVSADGDPEVPIESG